MYVTLAANEAHPLAGAAFVYCCVLNAVWVVPEMTCVPTRKEPRQAATQTGMCRGRQSEAGLCLVTPPGLDEKDAADHHQSLG